MISTPENCVLSAVSCAANAVLKATENASATSAIPVAPANGVSPRLGRLGIKRCVAPASINLLALSAIFSAASMGDPAVSKSFAPPQIKYKAFESADPFEKVR